MIRFCHRYWPRFNGLKSSKKENEIRRLFDALGVMNNNSESYNYLG